MFPLRILIVDSNIEFLESAAHLLMLQPNVQIVYYAVSESDALEQLPLLNPNLVLANWNLSDSTGLTLTRLLKNRPCPPHVVLLSLVDLPIYHTVAKEAGADGLICTIDWNVGLFKLLQEIDPSPQDLAVPLESQPLERADAVKTGEA
ncbi:MAG: response regulator transcription factor [Chloroflexi bacterium]|nr:response regulator transcription factor [Chloroflexota bacterium]